jgi:formate dehydrogenase subunit gamma
MADQSVRPVIVKRFTLDVQVVHWTVAICFILLLISGLGMFYGGLFFLTALFGGGETARQVHPWIGVVLSVAFFWLCIRFIPITLWTRDDAQYLAHLRQALSGQEEGVPEAGKFNAAQKVYFWAMALLVLVLLVTGLLTWYKYFGTATSIPTQRVAAVLHSIAAILAILAFITHVHMVTWERGTLRAMTRGAVTAGWGWKYHRKWLRELGRGGKTGARTAE